MKVAERYSNRSDMRTYKVCFLALLTAAPLLLGMGFPIDGSGDAAPAEKAPAEASALNAEISRAAGIIAENNAIVAQLASSPMPENISRILQLNKSVLEAGSKVAALLADAKREGGEQPASFVGDDNVFEGKVHKGDTIGQILENASEGEVSHFIEAAGKVFSFRSMREGQSYVVVTDPQTGRVKRFEYEINETRRLVVEGAGKPKARLEPIDYDMRLEVAEGVIDDNLFQAVADIGESPQLAFRLVKLFGSEINFIRDLQAGDSFSTLVEKRYRDGEYKGYGRILAAHFTSRGKKHEAYLFMDASGRPAYYTARGENLKKTLLQAPLAVTRLTSRFTRNRKHPILGYSRPHLGVDYGAPTGTPVKAVGDGIVTRRGWGGGYGNQIIIKHSSGLESMYAHLSGYARGLREGQKVSQGQVIGFVGSTGLSTGPHLDFRLRQNGNFIDPTKAINPRGLPVPKKMLDAFHKARDLELACLQGKKTFDKYAVDSIVPLPVNLNSGKLEKDAAKLKGKTHRKTRKQSPKSAHKSRQAEMRVKRGIIRKKRR